MKLVALMLARNEEWVIRLSTSTALRWVDHLVVLNHASTDFTRTYLAALVNSGKPVTILDHADAEKWDEMELRQRTLEEGRRLGGTHFAMVDADEVLTANLLSGTHGQVERLLPGEVLETPMVPVWGNLREYRDDDSVWSRAWISLVFADSPELTWKPREDGYEHHHRCPYGTNPAIRWPLDRERGGTMHLQFANRRRLLAKHVLYRMVDFLRWPGREAVDELNRKYDQALDERGMRLSEIPKEWWAGLNRWIVDLMEIPWQEGEIKRLLALHGREKFSGLDLKGF